MFKNLKNLSLLILTGFSALFLTACTASKPPPAPALVPTAPVTAEQKLSLYNYLLSERGVDIIKIGETYTIVISSDLLFKPGSANVNEPYVKNLKIIALLINSYDTTSVGITAYTDEKGNVARALTEKQAQEILYFLKKDGVDTRLIYAKGYGNLYPVSLEGGNRRFNRRVEIKFQFHPEGS